VTSEYVEKKFTRDYNVILYLSIFNSFRVIRCLTQSVIFVSHGDAPAIITQYVTWMERQFSASQTARSMYPTICNSFPVIRTAIAKNRRFHVPQPTFLFPLETPLRLSRSMFCTDGKTIQCLPNPSQHVPIYFQQCPSYSNRKCKKIVVFTYRSPHFCFLWRRPCDYHAICCMDGKTIQCLPNPLQHVPIYLQ